MAILMIASGELLVDAGRGTMTTTTIRDAYQHLIELEPGTERTMEQLRGYIQERGLRYEQLDEAFWDGLLDSAWVLGTDAEDSTADLAPANQGSIERMETTQVGDVNIHTGWDASTESWAWCVSGVNKEGLYYESDDVIGLDTREAAYAGAVEYLREYAELNAEAEEDKLDAD